MAGLKYVYVIPKSQLWVLVVAAAVLAIAVVTILAYRRSYDERNEDPRYRHKSVNRLKEAAIVASMVFMTAYIILVSLSGQYKEHSWGFGIILVLIGLAIMIAIDAICSIVAGRIWRKAQKIRVARRKAEKNLEGELRFYKHIANTSLPADLNREL